VVPVRPGPPTTRRQVRGGPSPRTGVVERPWPADSSEGGLLGSPPGVPMRSHTLATSRRIWAISLRKARRLVGSSQGEGGSHAQDSNLSAHVRCSSGLIISHGRS
jgi:hypothetical protein